MALCRDNLYIVSLESDQHQHQHGSSAQSKCRMGGVDGADKGNNQVTRAAGPSGLTDVPTQKSWSLIPNCFASAPCCTPFDLRFAKMPSVFISSQVMFQRVEKGGDGKSGMQRRKRWNVGKVGGAELLTSPSPVGPPCFWLA